MPPSIAKKFLFYHIRPTRQERWATNRIGATDGIQVIAPLQISLIIHLKNDSFECATVTGPLLNKFHTRYTAMEYQNHIRTQQAALWHLPFNNFFQGGYEVFNGPNSIDITR